MFSKKEFGIVSNLRFISKTNLVLNWVSHEKSFITSGLVSLMTNYQVYPVSPTEVAGACFNMRADMQIKYRIYLNFSDTSTPYHNCFKIWTCAIYSPMLCLKFAGWVSNSVDPDETLRSAGSHLGLNCLLRVVCPNTYGKYGRLKCKNIRFIYLILGRYVEKGTSWLSCL